MSDYLYHHGIKGQKWGVRRFQNYGGGLTAAGRLRYKVKGAVEKAKSNHAAKKEEKARIKQIEAERKKPVKYLTDDELRRRNARLQAEENTIKLEKRLSELNGETVHKGESFISKAMKEAVIPAALESGKEVLKSFIKKRGLDALGLGDAKSELDKMYEDLSTKKKIAEIQDYFENRNKSSYMDDLKKQAQEWDYRKKVAEGKSAEDKYADSLAKKEAKRAAKEAAERAAKREEERKKPKNLPRTKYHSKKR